MVTVSIGIALQANKSDISVGLKKSVGEVTSMQSNTRPEGVLVMR